MTSSGTRHVVVGAGSVGTATALQLADAGTDVTLISRSGRGPDHDRVERRPADAGDPDALTAAAAAGAAALYNCVNPPQYHRWAELWPPVAAALLAAAETTGAVLVTVGNLYPYGPVDGPMREGMPDRAPGHKARIRAGMTAEAMRLHRAGRIRAVEVRASDYVGAGPQSHLDRVLPRALAGRAVRMIGAVDQPHSWTWVDDVARALVTVATDERAWGRVWHAPTNPPSTQREAVHDHCRAAGVQPVRVGTLPHLAMRVLGLVQPTIRELEETRYQFVRPYVLDSSAIRDTFGLAPTPWDEICRQNVDRIRQQAAA